MSLLNGLFWCLCAGLICLVLWIARIMWLKYEQDTLAKYTPIRKGKFLRVTYPTDRETVQCGLLGPNEVQCTVIFFIDQNYLKIKRRVSVPHYPKGTLIEVFKCDGDRYKVRKQEA